MNIELGEVQLSDYLAIKQRYFDQYQASLAGENV